MPRNFSNLNLVELFKSSVWNTISKFEPQDTFKKEAFVLASEAIGHLM